MTTSDQIQKPLKHFRAPVAKGVKPDSKVERTGGEFGGGIIRGVSMIEHGEALGHGMWIDEEFLEQVRDEVNTLEMGSKSRHAHPSLSSDGTGKLLGRFMAPAEIVDGKVFADLHISKAAHKSPEGNLAEWYFEVAESNPESLGASIVFERDIDAENEFRESNQGEEGFKSPDKNNTENLRHCRLGHLRACDMVDGPAANTGGMFSEIPEQADELAAFICGLEGAEKPESTELGIDPDRGKAFLQRFLDHNNLELKKKEKGQAMTTKTETEENEVEAPSRTDFKKELKKFTTEFGGERGAKYFEDDLTYEESLSEELKLTREELARKGEEIKVLNEKLKSLDKGEENPVDSELDDDAVKKPLIKIK